jgi:hypothetical protein
MGRDFSLRAALAGGFGLLLAGCGLVSLDSEDHAWRTPAEKRCIASRMVNASAYVQPASTINGRGVCGIYRPFEVSAFMGGQVRVEPAATLDCNMTAAFDYWLENVVQPAAFNRFGAGVVGIEVLSSYSCRTRNSRRGAKMSEHAFGNAIDVASFTLADGREVAVKSGWRGGAGERAFLREIHSAACDTFYTVLGPEADANHRDHLHLDLARHNARGDSRYCR